ncbi:tape measure protein [Mesorhizobium sp. ASY16-5R]|uniref:tape measure protein n=1 Tax=Mesorhizobium sp. ASY16-5R TaxID=3445772 RepID=UPI003FA16F28
MANLGGIFVELGLSQGRFNQGLSKAQSDLKRFRREADTSLKGLSLDFGKGVAGGLAAGLGVQQFTKFADGATRITNALKVAGLEGKNLADTYQRLGKIALDNGASFESVASLYAKVSQNAKTLGITSKEAEEFTRRIAVGLKASGTDATAASAGIMQLNQALASGVLRGDEFNSVAENLPVVAKAIADGLGVTVGKLREMAADGALDARTVFRAFIDGSKDLDAQAAKTNATFSQAFENITTALTIAVGEFNNATGASKGFAAAITDVVAPAIVGLGNVMGYNSQKIQEFSDWLGRVTGLRAVGDEIREVVGGLADTTNPLISAFQTAQTQIHNLRTSLAADLGAISGDYDTLIQSLEETGRSTAAKSLAEEFERVAQKVRDGTFSAEDFDAAIIKLRGTGDAMASNLADALQIIQTRFAEAGAAAEKSFQDAGKALADAFGANAISTVNALIDKIGTALPDSVRRFGAALAEAGRLAGMPEGDRPTIPLPNQVSEVPERRTDPYFEAAGGSAGQSFGKGFQSGLQRYLAGGKDARSVMDLDDVFSERLLAFLNASGGGITINSGFRTFERQAELWQAALKKYGSPAAARKWVAPPGLSQHNKGGAADLGFANDAARQWAHDNAAAYGLNFRLDNEDWHIEAADQAAIEAYTDAWSGLRTVSAETTAQMQQALQAQEEWGQLASTAVNSITSALQDGKITAQEWLQIGVQIIQQLLQMKSIGGGGGLLGNLFGGLGGGGADPWSGLRGGGGGLLGGMIIPGILHKGGTVGSDGYDHSRAVPASAFAGARRLHKGLMPDEFATILQRGETVIPRGGFKGGGGGQDVHVTVGVSADNNGNLMPFVESVSQKQARGVTRQGLQEYDRMLKRTFGARMVRAQADQL